MLKSCIILYMNTNMLQTGLFVVYGNAYLQGKDVSFDSNHPIAYNYRNIKFVNKIPGIEKLTSKDLIAKDPNYATVICRCELVTKAEILDAIRRPLGAKTLDGIKFRTRARMGRCQGGFCTFRIMNILEEELGLKASEITKKGGSSQMVIGHTKDLRKGGE